MKHDLKYKRFQVLFNDFDLLCKTTLMQFQILKKLLDKPDVDVLFYEANDNEVIIDHLELKIREEIIFTIVQFTPKGADLRKIMTSQDITMNLERICDMMLNIMYTMRDMDLADNKYIAIKETMGKMLTYTGGMLKDSVISFLNEDSKLAYEVIDKDKHVNALYKDIKESLQLLFADKQISKHDVHDIIRINSIGHNLERIGDSSTNISESTIFMTEGIDIRHANS